MELTPIITNKDIIIAKDESAKLWLLRPLSLTSHTADDISLEIILSGLGIQPHLRGFTFIEEAIRILRDNPNLLKSFSSDVYREIAVRHGSTPARVEKDIRYAISGMQKNDNYRLLFNTEEGISNKRFIAELLNRTK